MAPLLIPSTGGAVVAPIPYVTTLAGIDGEETPEVYFHAGNGVTWHLRYNTESLLDEKWEFVGGPPLFASSSDQTPLELPYSGYQLLSGVSVNIAAPLAGFYDVEFSGYCFDDGDGTTPNFVLARPGNDPDTASDDDGATVSVPPWGSVQIINFSQLYNPQNSNFTILFASIADQAAIFGGTRLRIRPRRVSA